MQRLYVAAAQEIAEVCEDAPRCTPAEAAKGWLMAARFAMWRVRAADVVASKGTARLAEVCAYVNGLRSRLLQQAALGGGTTCTTRRWQCEEAPSVRWRQGGFGLLEAAARRHAREQRTRELELAKGQHR